MSPNGHLRSPGSWQGAEERYKAQVLSLNHLGTKSCPSWPTWLQAQPSFEWMTHSSMEQPASFCGNARVASAYLWELPIMFQSQQKLGRSMKGLENSRTWNVLGMEQQSTSEKDCKSMFPNDLSLLFTTMERGHVPETKTCLHTPLNLECGWLPFFRRQRDMLF